MHVHAAEAQIITLSPQAGPADICHASDLMDSQVYGRPMPRTGPASIPRHGAIIEITESATLGTMCIRHEITCPALTTGGTIIEVVRAYYPADASPAVADLARAKALAESESVALCHAIAFGVRMSGKAPETAKVYYGPPGNPDAPAHTDARPADEDVYRVRGG